MKKIFTFLQLSIFHARLSTVREHDKVREVCQGASWKEKDDSSMSENSSRHFIASGSWRELQALLYDVSSTLKHVSAKIVNEIREI